MSEEELMAEIMERVEKLYSIVNRIRFYREVAMNEEAEKLMAEAEMLRNEVKLSADEVERLADDLDEYYISGATAYGEVDPLTHWATVVYNRLFKS